MDPHAPTPQDYADDPARLLDLVQAVLEVLREQCEAVEWKEKENQLREICKTIGNLEGSRTSVPEEMRRLKIDLIGALDGKKEIEDRLAVLLDGMEDLLKEAGRRKRGRPRKHAAPEPVKPAPPPPPMQAMPPKRKKRPAKGESGKGQLSLWGEDEP